MIKSVGTSKGPEGPDNPDKGESYLSISYR